MTLFLLIDNLFCSVVEGREVGVDVEVMSMVMLGRRCERLTEVMNDRFRLYYRAQIEGGVHLNHSTDSPLAFSRRRNYTIGTIKTMREMSQKRLRVIEMGHYADFIASWQVCSSVLVQTIVLILYAEYI